MSNLEQHVVKQYPVWVFDCDGVILDSNRVKTEAFYDAVVRDHGADHAQALVDYHKINGGISRYKKFEWFLVEHLGSELDSQYHAELCQKYAILVRDQLLSVPMTEGALPLLEHLQRSESLVFIASGGPQDELRDIFRARGIAQYFKEIFGSPTDKISILATLAEQNVDLKHGVFIGDANADFKAAQSQDMDFVFVSQYAESTSWWQDETTPLGSRRKRIKVRNLSDLSY
jgi:phosphoglycolate phosphatase-like HAD superfamily hydrolase